MIDQALVQPHLDRHPEPLLFVTLSGAHLYGFESPDSDYDLRGCHVTPVRRLVALSAPSETHEVMDKSGPVEIDLVTHDIRKYFTLLLKNNGYVLEQVYSPIVVQRAPEFDDLREIARGCITRQHKHHFLRFGENQWELMLKGGRPTVKALLYTFRVLLAGIHLLRSGQVESNLRTLNETFRLSYLDDLIALKVSRAERTPLPTDAMPRYEREYNRLRAELEAARAASALPDEPTCREALDDLLVRVRMRHLG